MSASGWIGVDFDGTLAEYHGWVPGGKYGEPIGPMLERVKSWLADGVTVKIVTARGADPDEARKVQAWCVEHGLGPLEVTDSEHWPASGRQCLASQPSCGSWRMRSTSH